MRYIQFLVISLLLFSCGAEESKSVVIEPTDTAETAIHKTPKTYLENAHLKGKVASFETNAYQGAVKRELISYLELFFGGHKINQSTSVSLTELGYCREASYFDVKNKLITKNSSVMNEFGYPDDMQTMDATNRIINNTIFLYDPKGLLVKIETSDSNGVVQSVMTPGYDQADNPVHIMFSFPKDSSTWSADFTYDENDQILTATFYDKNGTAVSFEEMKYDENSNLTEHAVSGIANIENAYETYQYEFDDHGNWTKQTTYNAAGKSTMIVERRIVYFE